MTGEHLLSDVKTRRVPQAILFSPGLATLLQSCGDELVALYRAGVAKRTGRLAALITLIEIPQVCSLKFPTCEQRSV